MVLDLLRRIAIMNCSNSRLFIQGCLLDVLVLLFILFCVFVPL